MSNTFKPGELVSVNPILTENIGLWKHPEDIELLMVVRAGKLALVIKEPIMIRNFMYEMSLVLVDNALGYVVTKYLKSESLKVTVVK